MFFDIFSELCTKKGLSVYKVCTEIGLNRSAVAKWKKGATPNGTTIAKIADYFGVTTDVLLSAPIQPSSPALTAKDARDIARELDRLRTSLESGDTLMFDGDPMSEEARESILHAMELGLQAAKLKNKEKYTPKKYRKD